MLGGSSNISCQVLTPGQPGRNREFLKKKSKEYIDDIAYKYSYHSLGSTGQVDIYFYAMPDNQSAPSTKWCKLYISNIDI